MEFITPAEWGARINYDSWADTQYKKDGIAIHYGGPAVANYRDGIARETAVLRAWESYHIDSKGWRGIAYGYAIGASGWVYRLRGKNNYGAHQGDHDGDGNSNNKEIVPVVFILGQGQQPTPEMWESFGLLKAWLEARSWTEDTLPVYGHKQIQPKATACPGQIIMDGIAEERWEPKGWQKPGDPIENEADAEKAWRYMAGNTPLEQRDGVIANILMQHDARLKSLGG